MANLSNINNVLRVSSDLRVGINTDAASYALEIGGTNSGIKLKNSGGSGKVYSLLSDTSGNFQIYDDAAASGRLIINSAGNATFAGVITTDKIFVAKGQNVAHVTSSIIISQENTTKSQIRFYGADASTPGILEFMGTSSNGSVGDVRLTINADGSSTFAGNITGVGATFLGTASSGAALVTIENNSGSTATSYGLLVLGGGNSSSGRTFEVRDASGNTDLIVKGNGNVGIGVASPAGKLEVAGGSTLGLRLSNVGDQSAYDQVRMTYNGYNGGAPTVTFMPLTTPGGGNVDTTYHFSNSNGLNANNNRANVNIDGILYVGSGRQSGETTLIMRNYDDTLVDSNEIQNSIRMSGRYWSGSASQLVETRINSVHQESNGNGGSALTFWTQTGGSAATEQMRIDKVGNVGIGVTPTQKLDVDGQMTHDGLVMKSGTGLYVDTVTEFNITLDFVAGNWISSGLTSVSNNGLTLGNAGTYIMQVYSDDHSPGEPFWYAMYWSGIMSWYNSTTNQTNTQNPIVLQKAGHGDNGRSLEAQILWQSASGTPANNGLLQFKCSATAPGTTLRLRFRRLI